MERGERNYRWGVDNCQVYNREDVPPLKRIKGKYVLRDTVVVVRYDGHRIVRIYCIALEQSIVLACFVFQLRMSANAELVFLLLPPCHRYKP